MRNYSLVQNCGLRITSTDTGAVTNPARINSFTGIEGVPARPERAARKRSWSKQFRALRRGTGGDARDPSIKSHVKSNSFGPQFTLP